MRYLADVASFFAVLGLAVIVDHASKTVDATSFMAGAALWYGIRAWGRTAEVNTDHKNSEEG